VINADPKGFDAQKQPLEKTEAELSTEAKEINRLGKTLRDNGCELRVHNHTPEMMNNAREWRYMLAHTDPHYVAFCVDLNWVSVGGQDPLGLLQEAGNRVHEVHVRNEKNKVWLEDLSDGDLDYRPIAAYFRSAKLNPLIVVELAYMKKTQITRPLEKDLAVSRAYAEKMFGIGG
jgi:inosose dehydratase